MSSLSHIGDLEKSLSDFLDTYPITKTRSKVEATTKLSQPNNNNPVVVDEVSPSTASGNNKRVECSVDVKDEVNPWALIEKFQILQMKESKEKKQISSESKKKKMARALKDQIKHKEDVAQLEKAKEDRNLQRQQDEISKKWDEEQKQIFAKEMEKVDQLKKGRMDQINDNTTRKKKQLAAMREEDSKEIQEISKALVKEEQDKLAKKIKEREKWERIKAENDKKLEVLRLRKVEEERIDAKLMAEFTTKLDLEEGKRLKAIEDRARKLEANRRTLKNEPEQLLSEGMTSVELSMNKKIIEDAQAFLGERCA